jgi:transposase
METIDPNVSLADYFKDPKNPLHRQYLALRDFFAEGKTAEQIAQEHGYTVSTVYSLVRDFKIKLRSGQGEDPFFKSIKPGRKELDKDGGITRKIVDLRKSYLSVPEIKSRLDALDINVSERYISSVLEAEGFARMPRRDREFRQEVTSGCKETLQAPKSTGLGFKQEIFSSQLAGILCFIPYIVRYGLHEAILSSHYPVTQNISRLSAILCFLALKLTSIKRYSMDDTWCMDRGLGLFAGLNVLPKAAWYSSYSSGITREMNRDFLKKLHRIWQAHGLLSDTANLDFTTIPYWGDEDPFENNWSGKRNKALPSILSVLVQDPDSGILCYGDTTVRHRNQSDVVLEFLDFYKEGEQKNQSLRYLIFDSKATSYQNLNELNQRGIRFITIRRRGEKLVEHIQHIPQDQWKSVRVEQSNGKGRTIKVYEETTGVRDYKGKLRQVYITGNGKLKPAILITNDFDLPLNKLVRKYSRRWLIEKGISEQIEFFHLNRNSSGMVIKVDFDLTMTILAHNLYRVFAQDLEGYSHCEDETIFNKFIQNAGEIEISNSSIEVKLKKKRNLPMILDVMSDIKEIKIPWLKKLILKISASTST